MTKKLFFSLFFLFCLLDPSRAQKTDKANDEGLNILAPKYFQSQSHKKVFQKYWQEGKFLDAARFARPGTPPELCAKVIGSGGNENLLLSQTTGFISRKEIEEIKNAISSLAVQIDQLSKIVATNSSDIGKIKQKCKLP